MNSTLNAQSAKVGELVADVYDCGFKKVEVKREQWRGIDVACVSRADEESWSVAYAFNKALIEPEVESFAAEKRLEAYSGGPGRQYARPYTVYIENGVTVIEQRGGMDI